MVIIKTKISVIFDEIETEDGFIKKWQEAVGIDINNDFKLYVEKLIRGGRIKRRKSQTMMDDVNYCYKTITVFKDFDTYEEVRSSPICLKVRNNALKGGFIYESEIKYYSDRLIP